ncbi:MAG: hypothetical protein ACKVVP_24840 [Chloroflexota bacterium]
MVFFFELQIFVMLLLTIILGEVVGRGAAALLWSGFTVISHIAEFWARRHFANVPREAPAAGHEEIGDRWARTLLYSWRRSNTLLLIGAAVFGVWYLASG